MSKSNALGKSLLVGAAAAFATVLNLSVALSAPLAIKDEPLFLNETPPPLNMLVMSRDHRMYYEAYNDASDLDADGVLDTTYKIDPNFLYYGYFESTRCYSYSGGVFVPQGAASNKKCAGGAGGQWSGDWLNYVTMSRIDALRKVLYGGLRSTDTASTTILQRSFIPQDAHSWGKEYTSVAVNGYDIRDYAAVDLPTSGRRHLFANTTPSANAVLTGQQNPAINNVGLPLMRVLTNRNNRIWDWLSSERLVADTNIHSGASQGGVTPTDYVVRVQVCSAGSYDSADTNCKVYGSGNAKPTGLLQDYGENDSMLFGLLSGSYGKPHEGGVLRKAVSSLKNEIDLATGVFNYTLSPPGIINTIDRLRITGFNTDVYSCGWITDSSDAAGACSMWGNPTAEMMYEVVRYFSGKGAATGLFSSGANSAQETGIGLGVATWNGSTDPYANFPRCSKPFETVISDINPSYDSDNVPGSAFSSSVDDVPINASTTGQLIWNKEMGGSGRYFIGQSGADSDGAPSPKSVGSFGNIRGLAPEGPTKEGSYNSAAVSYYGLTHDLSTNTQGEQRLQTFAVALASPLPQLDIAVGSGRVTLVPFAKSVGGGGYNISAAQGRYQPTNQIVDFYVDTLTATYGKFRVNFEDVEQGADHDMDAIAIYEYQVNGNDLTVTVTSEYAAGGIIQHMGYVITGTGASDGTYLVVRDNDTAANADVDYFLDTPPGQPPGGNWNDGQPLPTGVGSPSVRTFTAGGSSAAGFLKDPLFYAAKWGGFDDTKGNSNGVPDDPAEWDTDGDGVPDNYFLVTNALKLKDQLGKAFSDITKKSGSASSAAVSSGSINDDTNVYQATFDARNWSGKLRAFPISDGDVNNDGVADVAEGTILPARWDASDASTMPAPNARRIFTVVPTPAPSTTGIYRDATPFRWASIGATLQGLLKSDPAEVSTLTQARLDYLRGDQSRELNSGPFRKRDGVLGDIVDSAPAFVGAPRAPYRNGLEATAYSSFRTANQARAKTVYVGANDGMLHAFDAETGQERFGFIPLSVFRNLERLADPAYTHRFYVNGSPAITDAYFANSWHTVLASGLNKGGQGIFALDVTDPAAITEGTADSAFLWEFTDAQSADLGYTYARPTITRTHSGRWVAIFGNGYNNTDTRSGTDTHVSATGNAVLYIVDIETGALVVPPIDTGVGMAQDPMAQSRPNGLSSPAVVDLNGDSIADYVYAGDLFGNLWKFDLTSTNPANWRLMYNQPIFKAVNGSGRAQPITERPQVDQGPNGQGMVVLFGTGKFLETSDRNIGTAIVQSFYGIYDANTGNGSDVVSGRGQLVQQSILGEGTTTLAGSTVGVRVTSNNTVDPVAKDGWFIDLVSPSGFQGEMQITDPVLRNGRVLFTTLIPDSDICAYGGRSWLMEVDAISGMRLDYSPFDFNADKTFDQSDYVTVSVGGATVTVPASGFSRDAIMSRAAVISGEGIDYAISTDTSGGGLGLGSGDPPPVGINPGPGAFGRQSWRQVR